MEPSSPNKRKALMSFEFEEHVQDILELQKDLAHVNGGIEDPGQPSKLNKGASPPATQGMQALFAAILPDIYDLEAEQAANASRTGVDGDVGGPPCGQSAVAEGADALAKLYKRALLQKQQLEMQEEAGLGMVPGLEDRHVREASGRARGGDAAGDGAAAGDDHSGGGAKGGYALVAPGLGSDAPVVAPSWKESLLEAVAALAQPQETLGITNHHSPAQATNKDAAYDGEFKRPPARSVPKPKGKPASRKSQTKAAAAAASDLDEYFEPSLHELNQMALIHYKTEFNRVLASVGLPPSAGVTAAGSQAGSNNHSLEDHEHHMSSIQAELEVFKQLWASPAAGAGGGGALAPAGGGGGDDEDKDAQLVNGSPAVKEDLAGSQLQALNSAASQKFAKTLADFEAFTATVTASLKSQQAKHPAAAAAAGAMTTSRTYGMTQLPAGRTAVVTTLSNTFQQFERLGDEHVCMTLLKEACSSVGLKGLGCSPIGAVNKAGFVKRNIWVEDPTAVLLGLGNMQFKGPGEMHVGFSHPPSMSGRARLEISVRVPEASKEALGRLVRLWLLVYLWHSVAAKPELQVWQRLAEVIVQH